VVAPLKLVAAGAAVILLAGCGGNTLTKAPVATAPTPSVDRFDARGAWSWLQRQVRLGPRPAGSPASRRLAEQLRTALPRGAFEEVPGGLRNVVGFVPGRDPSRLVVLGAHYDTKMLPGFVGANDGASGAAVVVQLARTIQPGELRPSLLFILFDGEEAPDDEGSFREDGMRGSKVAALRHREAEAMVLLDMIGDRALSIPRELHSDEALWRRLRAAARRTGVQAAFPNETGRGLLDDHRPFLDLDVPAIDVIDFDFPCWHETCDDLSAVSKRSLDVVGEAVYELLRSL
jgi:glutaminyl-peptide cyclotransferase